MDVGPEIIFFERVRNSCPEGTFGVFEPSLTRVGRTVFGIEHTSLPPLPPAGLPPAPRFVNPTLSYKTVTT